MKRYEPPTHRSAIGLAAVTMTAMTFGLAVLAPAAIRSDVPPERGALARGDARAPTEVTIIPSRIDVIATREAQPAAGRAQARARTPGAAPAI